MNEFTALMVFLLMPGILGILILDALVAHKPWSPFLYTIYAIVFGTAVYLIEQVALWAWLALPFQHGMAPAAESTLSVWRNITGDGPKFNLTEMLWGIFIAIPLAFASAWIVNKKILNRIAEWTGVSTKYGDENLFSYFLNSYDVAWVYVRDMEKNLTYQGQIDSVSESGNLQELVLRDVTVFRHSDSREMYKLPYIYLAEQQGHFTIEAIPTCLLEKEGKNG